jgi:hypothetical protein
VRNFIVFLHLNESLLLENIRPGFTVYWKMSFELAQEVSTVFKGTSNLLKQTSLISDVDKKVDALTALKSYLKRNDLDVLPNKPSI